MKNVFKVLGVACLSLLMSCNSEPSLQRYFVDHQDDNDFIAVDVPSSLLDKDGMELSEEEKETLGSIKKVNFLALKLNKELKGKYDKESKVINKILSSEKYETLMKIGSDATNIVLKFQGDDDRIDEVIVFATNNERGLALVRVLGKDMKPQKIAKLANSFEKMDLSAFKEIAETINIDD